MLEYLDSVNLERLKRVARNNRVAIPEDEGTGATEAASQLRAGLNGKAYSNAEAWMLPNWAIRRSKKEKIAEADLANDQHRNWTPVGRVGGRRFGVVDSSGLLTVLPECGSLDFWIQNGDQIVFPALADRDGPRLELVSPEDQMFEWRFIQDPVEFTRLIYHVCNGEHEYIYNEVLVKNHSLKDATISFYAVVRPMSARGVEPIEHLEFDAENGYLYTNGTLALVIDKQPNTVVMSTSDNINLPETLPKETARFDRDFGAAKGLATAILRYDVRLAPAASKRIFFTSPLSPIKKSGDVPVFRPSPRARDDSVGSWFDFSERTTSFAFPDRSLDPAVAQAKASLATQASSFVLSEDKSLFMVDWPEKARVLLALSSIGSFELARTLSVGVASIVADRVEEFEPLSMSPILWSLLQYHAYSWDDAYLREIGPMVGHLVRVIGRELETEISRLEPPKDEVSTTVDPQEEVPVSYLGVDEIAAASQYVGDEPSLEAEEAEEEPEPRDCLEVIRALWSIAALKDGFEACKTLGDEEGLRSLKESLDRYESVVEAYAESLTEESELFTSNGRQMQALELVTTASLLRTGITDSRLLGLAMESVAEHLISGNLVKVLEPTIRFSGYLGLRLGQRYAQQKTEYEVEQFLKRALEFIDTFDNIPEFVNPRTGGGSHGSGCSIKAATDLLLLVREMIAQMHGDNLVVLPAVPDSWYTSSIPLTVQNLPMTLGKADIEVGASTNQHQIEVRMKNLPQELVVHMPTLFALPMIKAFGGGIVERFKDAQSPYIRVVPLSNTFVATFHR
ncbi:MAG: hypothetical protein ACE5H4_07270 [Candidatus Thorarchaeota archaeon]